MPFIAQWQCVDPLTKYRKSCLNMLSMRLGDTRLHYYVGIWYMHILNDKVYVYLDCGAQMKVYSIGYVYNKFSHNKKVIPEVNAGNYIINYFQDAQCT